MGSVENKNNRENITNKTEKKIKKHINSYEYQELIKETKRVIKEVNDRIVLPQQNRLL